MASVNIVIVVDDRESEGLVAEHGLSVWLEASGRRVVFDTGQGAALFKNARELNLPLHMTDTLVLSHGHYDHAGGVPWVLDQSPKVHLYCHPGAKTYRYTIRDGSCKAVHIPGTARSRMESLPAEQLHWIRQALEVAPGIGITGYVPRVTDYENTLGPFFLDRNGKHPDPIDDDMALWIRTRQGLVVVVGCSHAGLINTLSHVCRVSGTSKIHAVLGGFHLLEASEARVERTISALMDLGPDLVVPCHCTGEGPMEQLQQAFGSRVSFGHAGASYVLGAMKGLT